MPDGARVGGESVVAAVALGLDVVDVVVVDDDDDVELPVDDDVELVVDDDVELVVDVVALV